MIGFIVDRMHVWTPDRDVVREFYRRYKAALATGKRSMYLTKHERKHIYRQALKHHRANRQLCIDYRF